MSKAIFGINTVRAVVVCAQGSIMHALVPHLGETPVPVLTSPSLGAKHAVEVLTQSFESAH